MVAKFKNFILQSLSIYLRMKSKILNKGLKSLLITCANSPSLNLDPPQYDPHSHSPQFPQKLHN